MLPIIPKMPTNTYKKSYSDLSVSKCSRVCIIQVFPKGTYKTQPLHNESQIVQLTHFYLSETGKCQKDLQ